MDGHRRPDGSSPNPVPWTDELIVRMWRAHRRWLAAVAYAHKPHDVDVEDILQEVAMRFVRNIQTLHDPDTIRPWLRTVAINVARSAGRRTRSRSSAHRALLREKRPAHIMCDGTGIEQTAGPRSIEDARSRGRRALELADHLPPHYREPLLLSMRGLSQKQIAETMDVPVTTIETRLIRARKMLRQELLTDEQRHNGQCNDAITDDYASSTQHAPVGSEDGHPVGKTP